VEDIFIAPGAFEASRSRYIHHPTPKSVCVMFKYCTELFFLFTKYLACVCVCLCVGFLKVQYPVVFHSAVLVKFKSLNTPDRASPRDLFGSRRSLLVVVPRGFFKKLFRHPSVTLVSCGYFCGFSRQTRKKHRSLFLWLFSCHEQSKDTPCLLGSKK
jgi:hypothetical protein